MSSVSVGKLKVDSFLKTALASKTVREGLQERYFDARVIKVATAAEQEFSDLVQSIADLTSDSALDGAATTDWRTDRRNKGGRRKRALGPSVKATLHTRRGDKVKVSWKPHSYSHSVHKRKNHPDAYDKFWYMSGYLANQLRSLDRKNLIIPVAKVRGAKGNSGVLVNVSKSGKIRFTTELTFRKLPGIYAEYIGKMFLAGIGGDLSKSVSDFSFDNDVLATKVEARILANEASRPFIRRLSFEAGKGARKRLSRLFARR